MPVGEFFAAVRLARPIAHPVISALLVATRRREPGPVVCGRGSWPRMYVLLAPGACWTDRPGATALPPGHRLLLPPGTRTSGPDVHWLPATGSDFTDPHALAAAVDHVTGHRTRGAAR